MFLSGYALKKTLAKRIALKKLPAYSGRGR
jgi:hypothetical protein